MDGIAVRDDGWMDARWRRQVFGGGDWEGGETAMRRALRGVCMFDGDGDGGFVDFLSRIGGGFVVFGNAFHCAGWLLLV